MALQRCSPAHVEWLRELLRPGLLAPTCIVVTPLSLPHVQRLRAVESDRLQVVWAEELDTHLRPVVDQVYPWKRNPVRELGRWMLANYALHRPIVTVVERVCNLSEDASPSSPPGALGPPARAQDRHCARHPQPILEERGAAQVRSQAASQLGDALLGVAPAF